VINVLSSSVVDRGLLLWISISIFYLQKVANGTTFVNELISNIISKMDKSMKTANQTKYKFVSKIYR
jgi:hypothetical protein